MKTVMVGLVAVVCFAGAAGFSWFVWSDTEQVDSAGDGQQLAAGTTQPPVAAPAGDVAVGVRSRPASPDQLFRMGVLLREQQQGLIRQREMLAEQENRLKLIYQDVENHQRQLDGMYGQLREKVEAGQSLLNQLRDQRAQLEAAEKKAAEQQQAETHSSPNQDLSTLANIKQMSRWFKSMDQEQAAKVIREMVNDGQTDLVVQLLSNTEDRNVSKILSALDDPPLVMELLTKMKKLVRTANRPTR